MTTRPVAPRTSNVPAPVRAVAPAGFPVARINPAAAKVPTRASTPRTTAWQQQQQSLQQALPHAQQQQQPQTYYDDQQQQQTYYDDPQQIYDQQQPYDTTYDADPNATQSYDDAYSTDPQQQHTGYENGYADQQQQPTNYSPHHNQQQPQQQQHQQQARYLDPNAYRSGPSHPSTAHPSRNRTPQRSGHATPTRHGAHTPVRAHTPGRQQIGQQFQSQQHFSSSAPPATQVQSQWAHEPLPALAPAPRVPKKAFLPALHPAFLQSNSRPREPAPGHSALIPPTSGYLPATGDGPQYPESHGTLVWPPEGGVVDPLVSWPPAMAYAAAIPPTPYGPSMGGLPLSPVPSAAGLTLPTGCVSDPFAHATLHSHEPPPVEYVHELEQQNIILWNTQNSLAALLENTEAQKWLKLTQVALLATIKSSPVQQLTTPSPSDLFTQADVAAEMIANKPGAKIETALAFLDSIKRQNRLLWDTHRVIYDLFASEEAEAWTSRTQATLSAILNLNRIEGLVIKSPDQIGESQPQHLEAEEAARAILEGGALVQQDVQGLGLIGAQPEDNNATHAQPNQQPQPQPHQQQHAAQPAQQSRPPQEQKYSDQPRQQHQQQSQPQSPSQQQQQQHLQPPPHAHRNSAGTGTGDFVNSSAGFYDSSADGWQSDRDHRHDDADLDIEPRSNANSVAPQPTQQQHQPQPQQQQSPAHSLARQQSISPQHQQSPAAAASPSPSPAASAASSRPGLARQKTLAEEMADAQAQHEAWQRAEQEARRAKQAEFDRQALERIKAAQQQRGGPSAVPVPIPAASASASPAAAPASAPAPASPAGAPAAAQRAPSSLSRGPLQPVEEVSPARRPQLHPAQSAQRNSPAVAPAPSPVPAPAPAAATAPSVVVPPSPTAAAVAGTPRRRTPGAGSANAAAIMRKLAAQQAKARDGE